MNALATIPACSPARACWLRAWDRAKAERLIPYRETPTTWSVKTYTVTVTGAGWSDLSCNCPAGCNGRICKHAAVVAKAIAIGVSPIRRTSSAPMPVIHGRRGGICAHDWQESGSADFVCTICGAWYSYDGNETDEEPPLRYQYEAQDPETAPLTADDVRCIATALPNVYTPAALLAAMGSDSLTVERSLHPVQRPEPDPARWLPSAAGAITRLPVTSALDSLFS